MCRREGDSTREEPMRRSSFSEEIRGDGSGYLANYLPVPAVILENIRIGAEEAMWRHQPTFLQICENFSSRGDAVEEGQHVFLHNQKRHSRLPFPETAFFFQERALTGILASGNNANLTAFAKLPLHLISLVNNTPCTPGFGNVLVGDEVIVDYVRAQRSRGTILCETMVFHDAV